MKKTKYDKTDEIYILSTRTGYIPQLRMYGPIPYPIKCPLALCMSMIIAGVVIHEYDPKTGLTVELTISNLYDATKFEKVKKTKKESTVSEPVPVTEVKGVKVVPKEPVVEEIEETPEAVKEEEVGKVEDVVEDEEKEEEESKPVAAKGKNKKKK